MTTLSPRLTHMLTLPVLVDLLLGPYAQAHNCLEEEVSEDVKRGLVDARLPAPLTSAIWHAMRKVRPAIEENELLDTLAKSMAKRSLRPVPTPDWVLDKMAALFTTIDSHVGRASDAARKALESPQGQVVLQKSLEVTGEYLAERLLPKKASA